MSQTLISQSVSSDATASATHVTWTSPSSDLWVASSLDAEGVRFLGFVELSIDAHVAVNGDGVSLGRHALLADAKRAVQDDATRETPSEAASWSAVAAPVLSVRELRAR
ncbi:hypothetical protein [Agrococcus sp. ProA11]|uniref:hypothetical protein n=1 Tax=Agrococcus chionoecetis TaxID=3153752 RepID=UPI0032609BC0